MRSLKDISFTWFSIYTDRSHYIRNMQDYGLIDRRMDEMLFQKKRGSNGYS